MYYSENAINLIKKTRKMVFKKEKLWNDRFYIGYSHMISIRESIKFESISRKEALILLHKDLDRISKKIDKVISVNLTQNQFDALVSLVYDIGLKVFLTSELVELLNKKEYTKVCLMFVRFSRYKKKTVYRLAKSRKEEIKLFKSSSQDG